MNVVATTAQALLLAFSAIAVLFAAKSIAASEQSIEVKGRLEKQCMVTTRVIKTSRPNRRGEISVTTLVSIYCNYPGISALSVLTQAGSTLLNGLLRTQINTLRQAVSDGRSALTFELMSTVSSSDSSASGLAVDQTSTATLVPN